MLLCDLLYMSRKINIGARLYINSNRVNFALARK